MKCNMGTTDRYIRATIGVVFAIYAVMYFSPIIAIPSIVIAYTVATRWCILYQLLGINTGCHLDEKNGSKGTRGSIVEGISISTVVFLIALIIYLIIQYIIKFGSI